jgi:hypothetical protein
MPHDGDTSHGIAGKQRWQANRKQDDSQEDIPKQLPRVNLPSGKGGIEQQRQRASLPLGHDRRGWECWDQHHDGDGDSKCHRTENLHGALANHVDGRIARPAHQNQQR